MLGRSWTVRYPLSLCSSYDFDLTNENYLTRLPFRTINAEAYTLVYLFSPFT